MLPLAMLLNARGHKVCGSDRSFDQGKSPDKFDGLVRTGITLYPQDGSGVTKQQDILVVSSAIEASIPDVSKAQKLGVQILKRAEVLSGLFNNAKGISVAGTSGKTTVTAMVGHILTEASRSPFVVNGGRMMNFIDDNGIAQSFLAGNGDSFVAETDESDGSIALYDPNIAVLTNIALDHKPLDELRPLFLEYLNRATACCVVNVDNDEIKALLPLTESRVVTYGIEDERADIFGFNLKPTISGMTFSVKDRRTSGQTDVELYVPGEHNVSNALAAIAVAIEGGVSITEAGAFMGSFLGTNRRLELLGICNDIAVYDDFAHNPDKITASLKALRQHEGRLIVMFQPHGYGPTKMLQDGLVDSFVKGLGKQDVLLMPEIFYAGGTAEKSISSADIIDAIAKKHAGAKFIEDRDDIFPAICDEMKSGDRIVIMGARDDTLTEFAHRILAHIKKTSRLQKAS